MIKYISILCLMFSSLLQAQNFNVEKNIAFTMCRANDHLILTQKIQPFPPTNKISFNYYSSCIKKKYFFHDSLQPKRYPLWAPVLSVAESAVVLWTFDRYILKENTAKVGIDSWEHNLKYGWEWGKAKFGQNFFLHMVSGASYFNSARPLGYSFYGSIPFTVGGSILTEYFSENTKPKYNNFIYMTGSGVFFGEIMYRLSSDILDESTRGGERVLREIAGGILDPGRTVTRFFQGKTFKVTKEDAYEKEPLNFAVEAGPDRINNGTKLGTGDVKEMLKLCFDYGNPFEIKDRDIMDYFKLNVHFSNRSGGEWLANVSEYGLLCGRNELLGKKEILSGFFQYYDFLDNKIYNLSAMAFGGGFISRSPLTKNTNFLMNFHLGVIPFGGDSKTFGTDTAQFRDYNYGGGLESKLECTLDFKKIFKIGIESNYFWIRTFIGSTGNYLTGIINPRLTFRFLKNAETGIEYLIYYNNKLENGIPDLHFKNSEEKIFFVYRLNCCNKK